MRKIEGHQPRFGIGALEQMAENLSCAGAHVENAFATGDIEFPASKNAADQRLVQRHQAADHEHRSSRSVVHMTNAVAVLLKRAAIESAELNEPSKGHSGGLAVVSNRLEIPSHQSPRHVEVRWNRVAAGHYIRRHTVCTITGCRALSIFTLPKIRGTLCIRSCRLSLKVN